MPRLAARPATDRRQATRRNLLRADGLVVALAGVALLVFGAPLQPMIGWPSGGTLTVLGVMLLAYGIGLLAVSAFRPVGRGITLMVALLNSLWFDASIAVAAIGPSGLTGTGRAAILAGGAVAMLFAVAQVLAVRQR